MKNNARTYDDDELLEDDGESCKRGGKGKITIGDLMKKAPAKRQRR